MNDIFEKSTFNKIFFNGKTYSNDLLQPAINNLVLYLGKNIVSDSPFVYLIAPNHIKTIIAYFAIIKAGYIVVLLDPDLKLLEINELIKDTAPGLIININSKTESFDFDSEFNFRNNEPLPATNCDLTDVCTIVYTAAEDGRPKGAMLTKYNLLANAKAILDCDKININSVCCSILPLHHLFGLQTGILGPLLAGSSIVLQDISDLRKIKEFVKDLKTYDVTNFYSIPMLFYLLAKVSILKDCIGTIKSFVSGGYKLSSKIYNNFLDKTGRKIHEGYGLTEAAPICTWHHPEDKIKVDSIGRPFSCCIVKIMNKDNTELPLGQVGEICIKGDNVMKGYFNHNDLTDKIIKNKWLHTGDLGKMDEESYIYITGLKKDMLNVGGKNVYPKEVEKLIKMNNNVETSRVYGEPIGFQGHKIKIQIHLKKNTVESQHDFKKWCRENISSYKCPKFFEFL